MTDPEGQQQQQPSEEELRAVGDTDVAPAANVPEHLQSAFTEGEPSQDDSYASVGEVLGDDESSNPSQVV